MVHDTQNVQRPFPLVILEAAIVFGTGEYLEVLAIERADATGHSALAVHVLCNLLALLLGWKADLVLEDSNHGAGELVENIRDSTETSAEYSSGAVNLACGSYKCTDGLAFRLSTSETHNKCHIPREPMWYSAMTIFSRALIVSLRKEFASGFSSADRCCSRKAKVLFETRTARLNSSSEISGRNSH